MKILKLVKDCRLKPISLDLVASLGKRVSHYNLFYNIILIYILKRSYLNGLFGLLLIVNCKCIAFNFFARNYPNKISNTTEKCYLDSLFISVLLQAVYFQLNSSSAFYSITVYAIVKVYLIISYQLRNINSNLCRLFS